MIPWRVARLAMCEIDPTRMAAIYKEFALSAVIAKHSGFTATNVDTKTVNRGIGSGNSSVFFCQRYLARNAQNKKKAAFTFSERAFFLVYPICPSK